MLQHTVPMIQHPLHVVYLWMYPWSLIKLLAVTILFAITVCTKDTPFGHLTALWMQLTVMIFTFLWAQQFTNVPAAACCNNVDVYYQTQRVAMHKKKQNNNNSNSNEYSQWTRVTQLELRDDCQLPAWDAELLGMLDRPLGMVIS